MDDREAQPYLLTLRDGLRSPDDPAGATLRAGARTIDLRGAPAPLLAAVTILSAGGATRHELLERAGESGTVEQARVAYYLERFMHLGMLSYTATCDRRPLATLTPTAPARPAMPGRVDPGARYALSRFAHLRREGSHFVLESPLGFARTSLHDARATMLWHLLAEPRTLDQICHELSSRPSGSEWSSLPRVAVVMLLGIFLGSGAAADEATLAAEDAAPLATWSFHDLAFHVRTRLGRHADPFGATFPFRGRFAALPAVKTDLGGPRIALPRPDPAVPLAHDPPLSRVLEDRRSIRSHSQQPIRLDQLAEFLYRSARVCALHEPSQSTPYPHSTRLYPGGGCCYPLEIYLAVGTCEGLEPGLYHYDPVEHVFTVLPAAAAAVATLLHDARSAMWTAGPIHTVVVLSARFMRLSWKYSSIPYSALLKDVGAVLQTMYLVATAMGLAPCALGAGDSELFADAAGLDYYTETSVGELALGGRPPSGPPG